MTRTIERETPEMRYLRGEVEVADGVHMTVLLFSRLVRELREAAAMLDDPGGVAESGIESPLIARKLARCRDILSFFIDTADPDEKAGKRLCAVYYTAIEQILTAQMEKSGRPIEKILPSIELMRGRWVEFRREQREAKR